MQDDYTVNQLAKAAGVSIRTLHYYDEINLLKPQSRSRAGYRYYGQEELLKLQQILFYKQLGFKLQEIRNIFTLPDFDVLSALESHRKELLNRSKELKTLLKTIDFTIDSLRKNMNIPLDKIYQGLSLGKR